MLWFTWTRGCCPVDVPPPALWKTVYFLKKELPVSQSWLIIRGDGRLDILRPNPAWNNFPFKSRVISLEGFSLLAEEENLISTSIHGTWLGFAYLARLSVFSEKSTAQNTLWVCCRRPHSALPPDLSVRASRRLQRVTIVTAYTDRRINVTTQNNVHGLCDAT